MASAKAKATREERNATRRKNLAEEVLAAKRADCLKALRLHSEVLDEVWRVIGTFGITSESLAKEEDVPMTEKGKAKRQKKLADKAKTQCAEDPKNVIDTKATPTLESFKVMVYRKTLLPHLDKVSFSEANLRQHENKEMYLQLLEFATGCPRDLELTPPLNTWSGLKDYLYEQADLRMGRLMGLALPAKWGNEFGLYKMDGSDSEHLLVRHRWTGTKYQIPLTELPDHTSLAELLIDKNYSEERAAIVSTKSGNFSERFQLSRVCTTHHLCQSDDDTEQHTPQTKKRTRAIAAKESDTKRYRRARTGQGSKLKVEKKEEKKEEDDRDDTPVLDDPARVPAKAGRKKE
eukprot:6465907-Amphidinium_carterae.2